MRAIALGAVGVSWLFCAAGAFAQGKDNPLPLGEFVQLFTDDRATTAQKEAAYPQGSYFQGTITVSDVQLYTLKGKGERFAEIKDWNLDEGCYVLLLRTDDVQKALALRKGDRLIVKARLAEIGLHVSKYVMECETYFAQFKEGEILEVVPSAR